MFFIFSVMMKYYFLFVLGLIWVIFAAVQDLRKREVANWLNFSLIAFALAHRFFYSDYAGDWKFFWFGVLGVGIFVALAFAFYYGKVFAGGDAKLLMGLGAIWPFESYGDLIVGAGMFIFILFLTGLFYTLFYSLFIVSSNKKKFWKDFVLRVRRSGILFFAVLIFAMLFGFIIGSFANGVFVFLMLTCLVLLYDYVKSVDELMIKKIGAKDLREGDWLEKEVRIGKRLIKKSVHGLSLREIELLKRAKKKVLIKEGVPFIPAFLIAYVVMVYAVLVLGVDFEATILTLLHFFS